MKILFLAPQPFFQERGTPIAVKSLLESLTTQFPSIESIDLVTYAYGASITLQKVSIHRTLRIPFVKTIPPGLSIVKILSDILLFFVAFKLLLKDQKNRKYILIHAVEESAFIAVFFKLAFKIPYVYDMDSSLPLQIVDKAQFLLPLKPLFCWTERFVIKQSKAVIAVCESLCNIARIAHHKHIHLLTDFSHTPSLSSNRNSCGSDVHEHCLKKALHLPEEAQVILYVGNFETYQGINLLLQGFLHARKNYPETTEKLFLVLIGGTQKQQLSLLKSICRCSKEEAQSADNICIYGTTPLKKLPAILASAAILASPRIHGNNTPMKIFSYMHSEKPLIATRIESHLQVLNDAAACLVDPTPESFSLGVHKILTDKVYAQSIAKEAKQLAVNLYSHEYFEKRVFEIYSFLLQDL
jgi:glycosyltransferase involved in cell wall biosynthesis